MHEPVPTWTDTVSTEDASALLDEAADGLAVDAWRAQAHDILPQPNARRRTRVIRRVLHTLVDHDGERIVAQPFLRLFQEGNPALRRTLITARTAWHHPIVERALELVVHPALALADEPLAPHDAAVIAPETWMRFLAAQLPDGVGESSIAKTRSQLLRHLGEAGVVAIQDNFRHTQAQHARPAPLAFAWLVLFEMQQTSRNEVSDTWALTASFAAKLFAPTEGYAITCIEAGIARGLLTRGYLAGLPRLHPGGGH